MWLSIAALAALLAAGCAAPPKKLYDGPDREDAEIAVLRADNSYVFSVNRRRTGFQKESDAELLLLPGTQRLIVHLGDDLAERYGYVGVPAAFCAAAGLTYTVYPVTDPIARLWQPAVREAATGADVPLKPCPGAEPPPAPAAAPPPPVTPPAAPAPTIKPAPAPAPAPSPPPPAATTPPAAPGTLAAGASARLLAPARTRSLPDAAAAKGLDAGVTVTLKVSLKKDTGVWWYVSAPAGSGWVREAELEPIQP